MSNLAGGGGSGGGGGNGRREIEMSCDVLSVRQVQNREGMGATRGVAWQAGCCRCPGRRLLTWACIALSHRLIDRRHWRWRETDSSEVGYLRGDVGDGGRRRRYCDPANSWLGLDNATNAHNNNTPIQYQLSLYESSLTIREGRVKLNEK